MPLGEDALGAGELIVAAHEVRIYHLFESTELRIACSVPKTPCRTQHRQMEPQPPLWCSISTVIPRPLPSLATLITLQAGRALAFWPWVLWPLRRSLGCIWGVLLRLRFAALFPHKHTHSYFAGLGQTRRKHKIARLSLFLTSTPFQPPLISLPCQTRRRHKIARLSTHPIRSHAPRAGLSS